MQWDSLQIQKKWQQKWSESKAFEPGQEQGKEKFFFTVPYPYVSGLLHVGHGRTYTNGDVIARFKRMAGFNVLWPMGFHITGTPVLAISAKIASGDAETTQMFEQYVGIYEKDASAVKKTVSSFSEPRKLVEYFSKKLVEDFSSMGYSLDFSRQFTTGDPEYNKFIEWQFHKYREKGYLKQASYPILYCTNDKNAVGEDDIKEADTVPVEVQRFTAFKFKLEGGDAFLVSCTLRPDTAFGITNLFVNPAGRYAEIRISSQDGKWDEKWVVSAKAASKLSYQGNKVTVQREFSGEELVGRECVTPLGRSVPVLPSSFVTPEHASGLVHSVPAHAPFDWVALQELKKDEKLFARHPKLREVLAALKPIGLIELSGYGEFPAGELVAKMKISNTREKDKLEKATALLYKEEFYNGVLGAANGEFAGMQVAAAKDALAGWLKKQGKAADFYENSRPATCRCGGEVVSAVLSDQWFIDYNSPGWKQKASECLATMSVFPHTYRKQFEDVFAWLDKRPCARRRGLGTHLPFDNEWIIESLSDSTIYMAFYTVIKAIRASKLQPRQLTQEFFDYVLLGQGGQNAEGLPKKIGTTRQVLESIREEFLYWYPNDLRHTGIAHITNHLSFFIFAHAAIFPPEHWPKGISLNELVLSEGSKMSKSKGNVVLLHHVAGEGNADVFRLYAAGAADFSSVLDYRAKDVEIARKSLARFVSTMLSLIELGGGENSVNSRKAAGNAQEWMESKFERAVLESTNALEHLQLRDYVQTAFHSLLKDYDYFVRRASEQERKGFAQGAAQRWIALLAPVIPHTCEELWEKSGGSGFVSLSQWPEAREEKIRGEIELKEDLVNEVISDGRRILAMLSKGGKKFSKATITDGRRILAMLSKGGKKFSKATIIVSSSHKWGEFLKATKQESAESAVAAVKDESLKAFLQKDFYSLKARVSEIKSPIDEQGVLKQAQQFVSGELGVEVKLEKEGESANPKAGKALPLKPAIVFE